MNSSEISAFAAYAEKNTKMKKIENKMGIKNKSKMKVKKKKKEVKSVVNVLNGISPVGKRQSLKLGKHVSKPVKPLLKDPTESISVKKSKKKVNCGSEMLQNDQEVNLDEKKTLLGRNISETKSNWVQNQKSKCNKKINYEVSTKSEITSILNEDSIKMGEDILAWLLGPVDIKEFFEFSWEKKPLFVQRNNKSFYEKLCTLKDFERILKEKEIYFTKNIDVTSYLNGERFTENPEGKATLPAVWDALSEGKSIRLLNPQTFMPNIRLLNTMLQEFFHCFVGANMYLTPAGTQGFAPHYDDIEAFVLQLEGEKHWKLYNPRCPEEVLPRESSPNFREDEIGEPILELTLKPGDLLYFPRGFIHQAKALADTHSLHVTVSCYQRNSWADLFEKIVPVALEQAISSDVEFRRGLPIGYLNHVGMMFSEEKSRLREKLIKKFEELARRMFSFCPLDAAADQMGVDFMQNALPPFVSEEEKQHGADRNVKYGKKNFLDALKNHSDKKLGVKLLRATSVRLVSENDLVRLYYTTDNSLVYRENEVSAAEIPLNWMPALDRLIHSYPNFVDMRSLHVGKKDDQPGKLNRTAELVYFLWQRGLVVFDKPSQGTIG